MATVGTTTQTDLLASPSLPAIARDPSTGFLYVLIRSAANDLTLYQSVNDGGSWAAYATITNTGLQEWSSLVIDVAGYAHLAHRNASGTADVIWYRRIRLSDGAVINTHQIIAAANGGTPGAYYRSLDLAVLRHGNGAYAILVPVTFASVAGGSSYRSGTEILGVSITASGAISNKTLVAGTRGWISLSASAPGRSAVCCEIQHTGDGISTSSPSVWVTWGRTTMWMVRLAWHGSGWTGPTNPTAIRTGLTARDHVTGRWDGVRWLMPVPSPDNAAIVRVYQRNAANTATSTIDTPANAFGAIRWCSISYDSNRNMRVYAVGTSNTILTYCDYTRATSSWGAWTNVSATAVLSGTEWSVKAGGTFSTGRHDVLTTQAASPNVVSHTGQTASFAPAIPRWNLSGLPYANGSAANVSAPLPLVWTFSDPDPGQVQGSYAVSRQIGSGTLAYWRASDSSWQAAEVQNASATNGVTLAAAWGADADQAHTYRVKVWDSTGVSSADYSTGLVVIPSVQVDPTMVTPGASITADQIAVSWTVAQQTAFRIVLATTGGTVVHDSGKLVSTDLDYTIPTRLAAGTSWQVTLWTYNLEGLVSAPVTRTVAVSYTPAPPVTSTLVASTTAGTITVTSAVSAPTGSQPATVLADLYRRPNTTAVLNANPAMAGSITGYTGTGGALSYSTAQAAPGSTPGSARLVPTGSAATPTVEAAQVVIDPARSYTAAVWIRADTGNKPIQVLINWYTAAGVFISASVASAIAAPAAGSWHYLETSAAPPATAGRATIAAGPTGTPAAGDAIYIDEMRLRATDTTTPVRVAADVAVPGVVADYGPVSGVDYEYRWVATSTSGTTSYGPWMG